MNKVLKEYNEKLGELSLACGSGSLFSPSWRTRHQGDSDLPDECAGYRSGEAFRQSDLFGQGVRRRACRAFRRRRGQEPSEHDEQRVRHHRQGCFTQGSPGHSAYQL